MKLSVRDPLVFINYCDCYYADGVYIDTTMIFIITLTYKFR